MSRIFEKINCCRFVNPVKDSFKSWVVFLASFLSHMLSIGFSMSIVGILTIVQEEHFHIDQNESSWMVSIHMFSLMFFAPVASWLIDKTSIRVTELIGGTCLILGLAISYFSTAAWHGHLLFGIVAGFGVSLCYVASSDILRHHFEKFFYVASALVILGYYAGMTAFPPLFTYILDTFGYNQALAMISSIHIVHLLASIVYTENLETLCEDKNNERVNIDSHPSMVQFASKEENAHDNAAYEENETKFSDLAGYGDIDIQCNNPDNTDNTEDEAREETTELSYLQQLKTFATDIFTWLFLFGGFFTSLGETAFFALINAYMISTLGISDQEAALGVTIFGATSFAGVIGVTIAGKFSYDRLILHTFSTTIAGLTAIGLVYAPQKELFYAGMAVYGATNGAQIANFLAVSYDLTGADSMAVLFGFELALEGIGGLVGAPLCSYIAELHNEKMGLILAGLCGIAATIILLPVVIKRRIAKRNEENAASVQGTSETNAA